MAERPLRVLIVDDNFDFAQSEHALLTVRGYECATAETVEDGVEKAKHFQPNVVLFDLGMPGDGFTLPGLVRQVCSPPPILIAISGSTDPTTRRALAEDDIFLYLAKPVEPDTLFRVLANVVK